MSGKKSYTRLLVKNDADTIKIFFMQIALFDLYSQLQAMYSAEDDNTEVLYFEDAIATFSSFIAEPKVIKL